MLIAQGATFRNEHDHYNWHDLPNYPGYCTAIYEYKGFRFSLETFPYPHAEHGDGVGFEVRPKDYYSIGGVYFRKSGDEFDVWAAAYQFMHREPEEEDVEWLADCIEMQNRGLHLNRHTGIVN